MGRLTILFLSALGGWAYSALMGAIAANSGASEGTAVWCAAVVWAAAILAGGISCAGVDEK